MGLITVAGIMAALAIFLLIAWLEGDPTNDMEQRQPPPSPESGRLLPDGARSG